MSANVAGHEAPPNAALHEAREIPIPAAAAVPARGALARELHDLLADIEDLARLATSLTGEELSAAKARLSERLVAARAAAGRAGGAFAAQARTATDATDRYVRDRPWTAIGIGTVVGLLAGLVLARR